MSHIELEFQHNKVTLTYSTDKNGSKKFFFIYGLKLYRAIRFGTHTYIASVMNCTAFHHGWAILAPWWPQTLGKGISAELPTTRKFSELFSTCFEIYTWNLVYTSGRWHIKLGFHHNQVSASGEFSGLFFQMFWGIDMKVGLYTQ